jgi:uncharacterized protein (DUF58 family)
MIALRRYEHGDSHRLIHWKASARTRRLLVRQFSAQSTEASSIWVRTDAAMWPRPEQFELLMSFAATLAEDFFRAGRLQAASVDAQPLVPMRRVADLESFLDRLAETQPSAVAVEGAAPVQGPGRRSANLLTFEPEGTRGVAAFINGAKTAAT